jgi:hypothetical protein
MHAKLIALAAAGVLVSAASAYAQTSDTATVTGVKFGNASNCFSVLLSDGNTYALSFGNNVTTPDLNVAMAATLGGSVGEAWTINIGTGANVPCSKPGDPGNTGPWPPMVGAFRVQQ